MLYEHAQFEETGVEGEAKVSRTSVEAGVMEMLTRMQQGKFKVFSHLNEWFQEFRLYHRKDGKIVKLRDDLMSATRYGYVMRRYAITPPDNSRILSPDRKFNWRSG